MIHGWHGPETLPTTTMPKLNSLIFVTPNYGETDIGGLATSARRIVRHLASAYPVTVVTPTELIPAFTYRVLDAEGVSVVEVGKAADLGLFSQFLADVIETVSQTMDNPLFLGFYCNTLAYATTLVAQLRGTAPLLFARGNDIDLDVFTEAAFPIHYALSHAQTVFCVSREIQAKVSAFCPAANTRFIANGLAVEEFPFQDGYAPAPRPVIGLFGDIKQKKGLDSLLAAMDFNRFSLRIVGELREETRKLLHGFFSLHPQAQSLVSHVPYVRGRDAMPGQYREVDIVCIPSSHEGMSNVMLEAMSIGKLCVCSKIGGALDVIRDGENGFLFEPRSVQGLHQALQRAEDCLRGGHETIRRQASATIRNDFSASQEREGYLRALGAIGA